MSEGQEKNKIIKIVIFFIDRRSIICPPRSKSHATCPMEIIFLFFLDEFRIYAEEKPEYAKLFMTYQELKTQNTNGNGHKLE